MCTPIHLNVNSPFTASELLIFNVRLRQKISKVIIANACYSQFIFV